MAMDGAELRRQILGDDWVRKAQAGEGDALDEFSQLAVDHVWGAFWPRPGLDTRLRSVATIAALASLEAHGELVAHVRGALRNGFLDPVQVRELLLHLTPYIGFPRARHAIAAVNDLLTEAAADATSAERDVNTGESDRDPQQRHSQRPADGEGGGEG